jgi:hypothetical protein
MPNVSPVGHTLKLIRDRRWALVRLALAPLTWSPLPITLYSRAVVNFCAYPLQTVQRQRRSATMLRAKAEQERDPEIRVEWNVIARGYLILASLFERNGCKNISYVSFPRFRDLDEEAA